MLRRMEEEGERDADQVIEEEEKREREEAARRREKRRSPVRPLSRR